jgi:uncharacterized protein
MEDGIPRREFLKKTAAAGLGIAGLARLGSEEPASGAPNRPVGGMMPQRILGRIGRPVSILGMGAAPLGLRPVPPDEATALVSEAIDLGVSYIDVAPNYEDAEAKLGPVMRRRRGEVFLVTKVEALDKNGVLDQIRESLRRLQTDHVDAVHLHNLASFDPAQTFDSPDGALAGLQASREAGYLRYIGVSGHMQPSRFVPALETGQIDLMMVAMNFMDRFTYNFEETVLPVAQRHGTAIAAMKVLGGASRVPSDPPLYGLLAGPTYRDAVRYALGLPGLSLVVLGIKNREELHQAVATVQHATPLTAEEQERLFAHGRELAARWGAHFGPV